MSDAYATLGLQRTASDDDIKKTFRSLALKHHPDRGGNAEEFKKCSAAYALISTPEKREQYDLRYGPIGDGRYAQSPYKNQAQYAANTAFWSNSTDELWKKMVDDIMKDPKFRAEMDKAAEGMFKKFQAEQQRYTQESMRQQQRANTTATAAQNEQARKAREMWESHKRNHYGI